jgi:hypothetical protein
MDHLHLGISPVLSSLYARNVVASLRATCILIGIWCLLSTLEWVSNYQMFREDGLLSWRILSLRPGLIFRSNWALFWDRSPAWVLSVRIAAAVGLMLTANAALECVALLGIVATSWFLTMRSWLGGDGADEIGQIASIGALLIAAGIEFNQLGLSFAGTLLIGGQLNMSYFFAGFSKLMSADWRQGRALVGVMGTHSYGHALAAQAFSRSSTFSACSCWLVILSETFFPLAMFAPHNVFLVIVAAFFVFHVSHAYFMGLNTFVWGFAAAYPSTIVLKDLITYALGSR